MLTQGKGHPQGKGQLELFGVALIGERISTADISQPPLPLVLLSWLLLDAGQSRFLLISDDDTPFRLKFILGGY